MKLLSYAIFFILVIFALALGSENHQLVDLNLLVVKVQLPLAVLLFLTFMLGVFVMLVISAIKKLITRKNA
ncbi:LapA family protein [Psychrosphaera sp. B3R10]|uniref:lipopolysaccharide assembly protein LapA domain-containing protein n=1 Tax=Psychrosphaera TaxID=907197 RepID=UPI001C082699|nr:LapA family protein [Psychrosphaera sp. I2R16]MBU2989024.1 LapA family protein [Psychrosphaera sp. B3R10]